MSEKILHNWKFPEYTQQEKNKSWYFWAIKIFLFLLTFSIFTANFLFGLIIIITAIILFSYHYKNPKEIIFSILEDGIKIDDKNYSFKELKNFYLIYEPPATKNLYIETNGLFKPTLIIPLQNENPIKIRETLKKHLEEDLEKENEPLSETLANFFKL